MDRGHAVVSFIALIAWDFNQKLWAQIPIGTRVDIRSVAAAAYRFSQNPAGTSNYARITYFNTDNFRGQWHDNWYPEIKPVWHTIRQDDEDVQRRSTVKKLGSWLLAYTYWTFKCTLHSIRLTLGKSAVALFFFILAILLAVLQYMRSSFFLLWVAFYRYPVFEVVYPRRRKTFLAKNHEVYSELSTDLPVIRVICLAAGQPGTPLECKLIMATCQSMDYEALSYVWGVRMHFQCIKVDGKPFYITESLCAALQALRMPDRDRYLWADAICIDQYNITEKGSQVQIMREIYASATRTIIWLGDATPRTSLLFDTLTRISNAKVSDREKVWLNSERGTRTELWHLLRHEWWQRVWVVQEAVVCGEVVVRRGAHKVAWDYLRDLIWYTQKKKKYDDTTAPEFVESMQFLRKNLVSTKEMSLLQLAHAFRFQSATFGSDKIYALMGLLPPDNPSLQALEYDKAPEHVFMAFTLSCFTHNKNLTILALATEAATPGISWCRDRRLAGGFRGRSYETVLFSCVDKRDQKYFASGTKAPVVRADLAHGTLSLQGYEVDTIDRVGARTHVPEYRKSFNWFWHLRLWEQILDKPNNLDASTRLKFGHAITAERWTEEPLEWRKRIEPGNRPTRGEYMKILHDTCNNRRFFVTKRGRFGLGPVSLQKRDVITILFGGDTPLILRPMQASRGRRTNLSKEESRVYHQLVGEAYVSDLMWYKGNIDDDISTGKVVPKWFLLK